MAWWISPREIADAYGKGTGRWRMTAASDEGGGIYADESHDHASALEASNCEQCDAYCSRVSGFPSRKQQEKNKEAEERAEYERLKAKFDPPPPPIPEPLTLEQQFEKLKEKYPTASMSEPDKNMRRLVTITSVKLPPGRFNVDECDIYFVVPAGYPYAKPDRFFTGPVLDINGFRPHFCNPVDTHSRSYWHTELPDDVQIWGWVVQSWDPRANTLCTYMNVIHHRLSRGGAHPEWTTGGDSDD